MEVDVNQKIKNYWASKCYGKPIRQELDYEKEFEKIVNEIREKEFVNPDCRENSMRASRFFMFLDLDPISHVINSFYKVKEGSETYPRKAMTKAMFWRRTKGFNFTEEFMHLKDYPEEACELGFEKDRHGKVKIPNWRTLRHFENERLGLDGQRKINEALVDAIYEKGRAMCMNIGENVSVDGKPIETFANDSEGEWNGHYKKKIVKSVILSDIDNTLPLTSKVIGGNDGEGTHLDDVINETKRKVGNGTMKGIWLDGGFTSDENLAKIHVIHGFQTVYYHITASWVEHKTFSHRKDGKVREFEPHEEIEWQYEKLWDDDCYIPKANFEYKMECLVNAGITEPVAAYFRNPYCAMYEEAPDSTLDVYHKRNCEEGIHGMLDVHYHMEEYLDRRGRKNMERTVQGCVNAALAVALTRLQHGIKDHLISTAYLS